MLIGTFIIKKTLPNLSKTLFLQPARFGMGMLHLSAVVLVLPEPGAPAGPWLRRGKAQNKMPSSFVVALPGALCAVLHLGQPTR